MKRGNTAPKERKKTSRKRRLARLPIAPDLEAPDRFDPSLDEWLQIESEYGTALTNEQRAEVKAIVDAYLSWQPSESAAPFVKDAERWLARLIKPIDQLRKVMIDPIIVNEIGDAEIGDAETHAMIDIVNHFASLRAGERWTWGQLTGFVRHLLTACERAWEDSSHYNKGGGFIENSGWNFNGRSPAGIRRREQLAVWRL